ncbi:MAG: Flp pilus assembly complex ATPase component TadA [Gemmatimonadales bacterium]|jgi:type II secretory ATPase GspE/PulE/Tfp pilus assembly ATPase PilB-like protein/CheY-like chemotaxis protein|nr:Flp pilus assembly complex ATPase component TadA [Gemmatimonadales bacterium]
MAFTDEWLVATVQTLLPPGELEKIRTASQGASVLLWDQLVERKLATDDQILQAVAKRFRLPLAELAAPDARTRDAVPENLVRRFMVLPLRLTDSFLEVATSNPFDIDAEKMLAFASGREVRMLLASPRKIRERIDESFRGAERPADEAVQKILGGLEEAEVTQLEDEDALDLGAAAEEAATAPIVRLVDMMLADGIASRASDLHIEPVEGGVVVRYRIDGVLRQVMKIPRSAGVPLISRIKIMSGLDIADRRRPQDGRARVAVNGSPVDLRVSTLPATHGEKVVIRVLNQKSTVLTLPSLGLYEQERETITRLLGHKEGIVLVTGPTGSGKTTTLYSALRLVQSEGVNIVTVEDPVEYRLGENIVQVQVNEKAGLTFAAALRSILRQDPDVVLVGEIRDHETAQIAVQASLTGHLVLSTLHTNDAPNAVTRLVDMGMEAYKIASALRGVVAQRLMRRLCPACRQESPDAAPLRVRRLIPEGKVLYRAVGCPECAMTGYRGRFSIVEVLTMNQELEQLIGGGATADRIAEAARRGGMQSLWESGLRHVLDGESTVEELLRVTDVPHDDAPAASAPARSPAKPAAPRGGAGVATPMPAPAPLPPDLAFELVEEIEGPAEPHAGRGEGRCVLLVEDEDQLRRVMRDLLEREGYRVAEARDGAQALDEVDRHAPDLIMLDLNLPGLDGYGVLQRLRSRPSTSEIPVIVLTAKGDEDNEVRVFQLGADDFLTKPFRARALSARLEAVMARRRAS